MSNRSGKAEAYKDVIHEDAIKVGAPDYCFRIGGTRKFFLEAKKPSVNLKENPNPAYQLRRYAWSGKLPLSILTDFEEFAVYDCRIRPTLHDKPVASRTLYLTYKEYIPRWDEIASVFSKDAIEKGSFDKYAIAERKRGTTTVDAAFLAEIEEWREALAKNIALRNINLSVQDLNFAVQRTIDRLIFLRICEDRSIEPIGQLQSLISGENIYSRLRHIYEQADDKYNSGLFHFRAEKGREEEPDSLTPQLAIDDKILKDIIRRLYYPESPYEFSVFPAEILGQVYEQFLGKVIRLTTGHQAKVEEKPEVKKAGGVYYTPAYIVDYIVEGTVGQLCRRKSPKEVAKLKILDPACGSGSFLIGAYSWLLNYHRDWYELEDPHKYRKQMFQAATGEWRLTTYEKKRILLANIYGVDIDGQAVEVTKLSLLLKVLEGESDETLKRQLSFVQERALPDLACNIKSGNSLIESDYFTEQLIVDEDAMRRVNPFNWKTEFSNIIESGGFDVVIGNPPYIGFHGFKDEKEYLKKSFLSATGRFDYYLPFIERGLNVLRQGGLLGYICPTNFTKREHGERLREHISESVRIRQIVDFKDTQIFNRALNYTGIFIFETKKPTEESSVLYKERSVNGPQFEIPQSSLSKDGWVFLDKGSSGIVSKIREAKVSKLGDIARGISEGIVTGQNEVFLVSAEQLDSLGLEKGIVKPCLRGKDIRRYGRSKPREFVIYPYELEGHATRVIQESVLKDKYPKSWSYLCSKRQDLEGRSYFESSSKEWFELWCQRDLNLLSVDKIVVPELSESNRFCIASKSEVYGDTVCGITLRPDTREALEYVIGILNSKLIEFYYKSTTVPKANKFYIYKTMFLKSLPIRRIDFENSSEKASHDQLATLVKTIIEFNEQYMAERLPAKRELLKRQIDGIDREIEKLICTLYGLKEDDMKSIEKGIDSWKLHGNEGAEF